MFAKQDGEDHDRHQEQGCPCRDRRPVLAADADDGRNEGGAVWAVPEVSSTAKAYSFHEKIRQKMAVEAMPVAACGNTTL